MYFFVFFNCFQTTIFLLPFFPLFAVNEKKPKINNHLFSWAIREWNLFKETAKLEAKNNDVDMQNTGRSGQIFEFSDDDKQIFMVPCGSDTIVTVDISTLNVVSTISTNVTLHDQHRIIKSKETKTRSPHTHKSEIPKYLNNHNITQKYLSIALKNVSTPNKQGMFSSPLSGMLRSTSARSGCALRFPAQVAASSSITCFQQIRTFGMFFCQEEEEEKEKKKKRIIYISLSRTRTGPLLLGR